MSTSLGTGSSRNRTASVGRTHWLNFVLGLGLGGFIFLLAGRPGLQGPGATAGLILWCLMCGWSLFAMFHFQRINPHRFVLFFALAFGTFWAIQFSPPPEATRWAEPRGQAYGTHPCQSFSSLAGNGRRRPINALDNLSSRVSITAAGADFIPGHRPGPAERAQPAAGDGGTDGTICHIALASTLGNWGTDLLRVLGNGRFLTWGGYYLLAPAYLLFTLLLGMGWCAWSCGYGAWDELASRLGAKGKPWPLARPKGIWKYANVGLLLSVVLLAFSRGEAFFCQWACPFKWFENIFSPDPWLRHWQIGASLTLGIGLVLVLPALTGRRTFCRYICPFGAWQSLAGRVNPFLLQVDPARCNHCGLCQEVCPVQAVTMVGSQGPVADSHCVRCGRCVDACPNSALRIAWRRLQGGEGIFFSPMKIYILTAVLLAGIIGAPAWMRSGARFWRLLFGG